MTGNGFHTSKAYIADLSELFTFFHFGDMYLYSGNTYGFNGIKDCDTGMGIGSGIDNDSI